MVSNPTERLSIPESRRGSRSYERSEMVARMRGRVVVRCLDVFRMELKSTERAFLKPEAERSRSGVA